MKGDILDDYLSGKSDLSNLYDETRTSAEVAKKTDDAILAAARRELNTGPTVSVTAVHHPKRWMLPLSAAAVIVLSTTIYITNDGTIHSQVPVYDQPDPFESKRQRMNTPAPASSAFKKSAPAKLEIPKEAVRVQAKTKESRQRLAAPARSVTGAAAEVRSPQAPAVFADSVVSGRLPLDDANVIDPATWLTQIIKLLEQGEHEQADAQLAAFSETYPDYTLSDSIKALLAEKQR